MQKKFHYDLIRRTEQIILQVATMTISLQKVNLIEHQYPFWTDKFLFRAMDGQS